MTNTDKWNIRFLRLSYLIASWSKDPSTQCGAVIIDNRRIVSCGYNGLPQEVEDLEERYTNRELKYKLILHAERNALLFANRSLKDCTIYTVPMLPCSVCAAMIIQAGIKEMVAIESLNPRWQEDIELTKMIAMEAGVQITLYEEKELL